MSSEKGHFRKGQRVRMTAKAGSEPESYHPSFWEPIEQPESQEGNK